MLLSDLESPGPEQQKPAVTLAAPTGWIHLLHHLEGIPHAGISPFKKERKTA